MTAAVRPRRTTITPSEIDACEAARDPVGEVPGRQREDRQRRELEEADQAEVERVLVDRVDLPPDRDRDHVLGEAHAEDRRPQEREVA